MDPNNRMRTYLIWTLVLIAVLLISGVAIAGEKILYTKIQTIEPDEVNGQYCYVKIIIKQKGDTIFKEEILECADGKKGIETPGYWDLFAQFYYRDINTPEYCRYYSRNKHMFKTPGKVCLKENGEWEVN